MVNKCDSFLQNSSEMSFSDILHNFSKNTPNCVFVSTSETPVGKVVAAADDDFLYLVSFEDSKNLMKSLKSLSKELSCKFLEKKNKVLLYFEDQLLDYFDGKLKSFNIPIKTMGSEFQKEVWEMLQKLPYASTQTYGELAKAMGRPGSYARAIGSACGANSHLLVVPCHRVVAAGFNGGFSCGKDRKEWLLDHERKHV